MEKQGVTLRELQTYLTNTLTGNSHIRNVRMEFYDGANKAVVEWAYEGPRIDVTQDPMTRLGILRVE